MKNKFELSVSISPEEAKILKKAESILENICHVFNEHSKCDMCPMHAICYEKLKGVSTPNGILYHVLNVLNVEEEVDYDE